MHETTSKIKTQTPDRKPVVLLPKFAVVEHFKSCDEYYRHITFKGRSAYQHRPRLFTKWGNIEYIEYLSAWAVRVEETTMFDDELERTVIEIEVLKGKGVA